MLIRKHLFFKKIVCCKTFAEFSKTIGTEYEKIVNIQSGNGLKKFSGNGTKFAEQKHTHKHTHTWKYWQKNIAKLISNQFDVL